MNKKGAILIVIVLWVGLFLGAIGHELDMRREYNTDKTMDHTSWVTTWPTEAPK
jgi:hypothetical protein